MVNWFESLIFSLPTDGWERVMFDAFWQSTLICVFAIVISRWCVHQAAARSWLLTIAFAACIFLPAISHFVRSTDSGLKIPFGSAAVVSDSEQSPRRILAMQSGESNKTLQHSVIREDARTDDSDRLSTSARTAESDSKANTFFVSPDRLVGYSIVAIKLIWACVSLCLLFRLAAGAMAVRRTIRHATACENTETIEALSKFAKKFGLKEAPRLLLSDQLSIPMTLALFRPVLLMPTGSSLTQSPKLLEATIAHELAHIRRCDGWTKLLAQITTALIPIQPLVWWTRKELFDACEEACDDWAVATGNSPLDLATVLTETSTQSCDQQSLLIAVGMSGTRSRVLRLLSMENTPSVTLSSQWRLIATTLVVVISSVIGFAQPQTEKVDQSHSDSISGECVDENGKPIPQATVRLFLYGQDAANPSKIVQSELGKTDCDARGQFSIENISHKRKSNTLILIAQCRRKGTVFQYITPDTKKTEFTFELRPAAPMKGRVTNEEGEPVAGAIVSAGNPLITPVNGIRTGVTDEKGFYEIYDLNAFDSNDQKPQPVGNGAFDWSPHSYGQIRHPDYARSRFTFSKVPSVTNITLQRPATVEGQITLKESGKPAAGVQVEFWNDLVSADSWTRSTTDENGNYRIKGLPPGKYRMNAKLDQRPNLARENIELSAGINSIDFAMERGGTLKGQVVNAFSDQPIRLAENERMQVIESTAKGHGYRGMNYVDVNSDGSFELRLPAGRRFLGMYLGPNWQGVNTDRLVREGIEITDGEVTELEIRVKPREEKKPLVALSRKEATDLAEQIAIEAIKKLGGWVKLETIKGSEHVVEVNMVYHEDERTGRSENRIICDECLSYVKKFPWLKRLMLTREQATDSGLAHLRDMSNLEEIWIWDATEVGDQGTAHLSQLRNLKSIHIEKGRITDESLRHFAKLPHIERLGLQRNRFTDAGLEHLKNCTTLTDLVLGLGECEITDEGLRSISKLTKLERLGIQHSKVTDAGLKHLYPLAHLRSLWVGGTQVTQEGADQLADKIPGLKKEKILR